MSSTGDKRLKIDWVPIRRLKIDPGNPRRISPGQLEVLGRSIDEFGLVQPILARREDRTVIAGHQRLAALIARGDSHASVVWLDLSVDQAHDLALRLNRIGGVWDEPLLARMLDDLQRHAVDLTATGFDRSELDRLLASLQARERRAKIESFDFDAALAASRRTGRASPGDLFLLGDHRLVVGDATDPPVIDRLLGDQRPSLTVTDPPYNVAIGDHGGHRAGSRRRRIANDALAPEAWREFIAATTRLLVDRTDGAIYCFMSSKEWPTVSAAFEAAGGHWSDTIVWRKDRFVLGRADYQRSYEPIWYGWREGADHFWCGDRDQPDVWAFDRSASSPLHPTMKPLELIERAIENSSRPGDLVLDPFGGSGTTLIAVERTARRCAMVELDPAYADVIVARWECFTGETARRVGSAQSGAAA